MANTKSAIKRIKQFEKRRLQNRIHRGSARTYVKQARSAIQEGNTEEAQVLVKQAVEALDRATQKGVIHKNNAARRKARLMKALNAQK